MTMMHNIYVKDLLSICKAELIVGNPDLILNNFSKDTRTIKKNDVYLGIKGGKNDGNNFYEDAFQKGACCCILDNLENVDVLKYSDKTIIKVEDTVKCLQQLATYKRSMYDIPVIAITGSVGKTSTKDMIYEVISKKYKTLKTEGNLNNHIGLPLTILRLKEEEALVVEMGMNHLSEIRLLSKIAQPTIAIITNVGTAHIGLLGSRENILKAKLEILEGLTPDGIVIINNDNDLLHQECKNLKQKYNITTIGIENNSSIMATEIEEEPFNSKFKIGKDNIEVNIGSRPFIYNSLIAYATGIMLNVDKKKIKDAIKNCKISPHRLEKIINQKGVTIIDDTYNANVDSMISAIKILGSVQNKRRIALLGDMLELGKYAEQLHRIVGQEVAKNKIDILITVGSLTKNYLKEEAIKNHFDQKNIFSFNSYEETLEPLKKLLTNNDIILLKGSNSMNITKIVEKIK